MKSFNPNKSSESDSESEDAENDGPTAKDEDPTAGDEGLAAGHEGLSMRVKSLGLGGDEAVPTDLYHSLRDQRVSALRQPTLTTWIDPEDDIAYIDVPAYPPPAPPIQTSPSPEWSSGLLPVYPAPSIVPLLVSSPVIPLAVPSLVVSHATTETEGFLTELGAWVEMQGGLSGLVRDEIFSQRYQFRSLEHKQERVAVTFGAIWRPVLALESWAGQTDAQRVAPWHAISDTQMENWELRLQIIEERRVRLDLAEIFNSMRRGQEPRGDV
ncbi:hypothetical protein Tco_1127031 [Tanacetum coccineum]